MNHCKYLSILLSLFLALAVSRLAGAEEKIKKMQQAEDGDGKVERLDSDELVDISLEAANESVVNGVRQNALLPSDDTPGHISQITGVKETSSSIEDTVQTSVNSVKNADPEEIFYSAFDSFNDTSGAQLADNAVSNIPAAGLQGLDPQNIAQESLHSAKGASPSPFINSAMGSLIGGDGSILAQDAIHNFPADNLEKSTALPQQILQNLESAGIMVEGAKGFKETQNDNLSRNLVKENVTGKQPPKTGKAQILDDADFEALNESIPWPPNLPSSASQTLNSLTITGPQNIGSQAVDSGISSLSGVTSSSPIQKNSGIPFITGSITDYISR